MQFIIPQLFPALKKKTKKLHNNYLYRQTILEGKVNISTDNRDH